MHQPYPAIHNSPRPARWSPGFFSEGGGAADADCHAPHMKWGAGDYAPPGIGICAWPWLDGRPRPCIWPWPDRGILASRAKQPVSKSCGYEAPTEPRPMEVGFIFLCVYSSRAAIVSSLKLTAEPTFISNASYHDILGNQPLTHVHVSKLYGN